MLRILLISVLGLLTSCNEHSNTVQSSEPAATPVVQAKDNFKAGEVTPLVPLHMDAGETFAVYLPKGYTDSAKLPVIIFFDPHGDGSLPLGLYKDLADQYHYILVGSNTSKNGIPLEQTQAIAYNLFTEVKSRLSVNTTKIALCGFSGGAKVALLSGASNPEVSNIIYAGAKVEIKPTHPLTILGFAGVRDMNYTDLVMFDQALQNPAVKHFLVEWNGKHEFPSAEVFKDAFVFLNTGTVENYAKKGVTITPANLKAEQDKKSDYIDAFQKKDLAWWKKEIDGLNAKKKTDIMSDRLLGFLSLACYSIGGNELYQNKLTEADKFLKIYKMADPGNKDCDSMMTVLYQKRAAGPLH